MDIFCLGSVAADNHHLASRGLTSDLEKTALVINIATLQHALACQGWFEQSGNVIESS